MNLIAGYWADVTGDCWPLYLLYCCYHELLAVIFV